MIFVGKNDEYLDRRCRSVHHHRYFASGRPFTFWKQHGNQTNRRLWCHLSNFGAINPSWTPIVALIVTLIGGAGAFASINANPELRSLKLLLIVIDVVIVGLLVINLFAG